MRSLKNGLILLLLSSLIPLDALSEEAPGFALPGTFPGSGGFPEPPPHGDLPPAYPEWPERPFPAEIVPPPPAGPYMSSAMMEINVFPDDTGGLRHEIREEQMRSPFFSADMPWPETPEKDRPQPWLPESGEYNYVPEEVVRQLESPAPFMRPQYQGPQPYQRFPPPPPVRRPYYGYY